MVSEARTGPSAQGLSGARLSHGVRFYTPTALFAFIVNTLCFCLHCLFWPARAAKYAVRASRHDQWVHRLCTRAATAVAWRLVRAQNKIALWALHLFHAFLMRFLAVTFSLSYEALPHIAGAVTLIATVATHWPRSDMPPARLVGSGSLTQAQAPPPQPIIMPGLQIIMFCLWPSPPP